MYYYEMYQKDLRASFLKKNCIYDVSSAQRDLISNLRFLDKFSLNFKAIRTEIFLRKLVIS